MNRKITPLATNTKVGAGMILYCLVIIVFLGLLIYTLTAPDQAMLKPLIRVLSALGGVIIAVPIGIEIYHKITKSK